MPEEETIDRAREDAREGKSPSTQAGEFVREEMEHIREGKLGARSRPDASRPGHARARYSKHSSVRDIARPLQALLLVRLTLPLPGAARRRGVEPLSRRSGPKVPRAFARPHVRRHAPGLGAGAPAEDCPTAPPRASASGSEDPGQGLEVTNRPTESAALAERGQVRAFYIQTFPGCPPGLYLIVGGLRTSVASGHVLVNGLSVAPSGKGAEITMTRRTEVRYTRIPPVKPGLRAGQPKHVAQKGTLVK